MTKLELPLHPKIETIFGYAGSATRVVFFWEPQADKLMYDDGTESGSANSWAYLIWSAHPAVKPQLSRAGRTMLLLERGARQLFAVGREEAALALKNQGEPAAPAAPADPTFKEAQKLLADFVLWLSSPAAKAA